MPNYKKIYYLLFNQITDIIELLNEAQLEAEKIYTDDKLVSEKHDINTNDKAEK